MISTRKRFLFIHVPKTGGNSIQSRLHPYSDDRIVRLEAGHDGIDRFELRHDRYPTEKHSSLTDYERVVDPEVFRTLFKFATIRNPWDRLISFYFSPHRGAPDWDRDAFKAFVQTVEPLRHYTVRRSWKARFGRRTGRGRQPRCAAPLEVDVDFLMRFEHLDADFRTVCAQLDIPYTPLSRRNVSERSPYHVYYDDELIELVADLFGDEIEHGSYEFETTGRPAGTSELR